MYKLFKKCLNHYVLYLKMLLSSIKLNTKDLIWYITVKIVFDKLSL